MSLRCKIPIYNEKKKKNPIDVIFKDKAKFDVQNPVIGSLVSQVQEHTKNERAILNPMSIAPSTKDVYITERLAKLKDDNNDDDDNFPLPPPPPPPSMSPGYFCSRRRAESDDDYDNGEGRDLTPTQRFLFNQPQQEKIAIAVGERATTSTSLQVKPRKVKFSEKLNKVFP